MNDAVTGPPPGTRPSRNPSPLPRSIGRHEARQSASDGHRLRMRSVTTLLFASRSTLLRTSVNPNSPMTTARSSTPADRLTDPKVKRSRPFTTSMPTAAIKNPSAIISTPFTGEPLIMKSVQTTPSTIKREVLGWAEPDGDRGDGRSKERHHDDAQCACDERSDCRDAERRPRASLFRHLVTVDAGHDGRGFARNVQQDRGRRAAIHRAIEDRREHHHPADRRHRERDRQQQRQRRERTDARQHADQRSD